MKPALLHLAIEVLPVGLMVIFVLRPLLSGRTPKMWLGDWRSKAVPLGNKHTIT